MFQTLCRQKKFIFILFPQIKLYGTPPPFSGTSSDQYYWWVGWEPGDLEQYWGGKHVWKPLPKLDDYGSKLHKSRDSKRGIYNWKSSIDELLMYSSSMTKIWLVS